MAKVKQQIKNAIIWIDRLKTTKLKQGSRQLGDSKHGYCCLGYGCKILKVPFNPNHGTEPAFADKVGLDDDGGTFTGGGLRLNNRRPTFVSSVESLMELNDDAGYSFRKISTFIKKNVDVLFIKEVAEGINKHYTK